MVTATERHAAAQQAAADKQEAKQDAADKSEKAVAARAALKVPEQRVLGTITWLGEGEDGPRVNEWNGLKFKVGEAVEVTSQHMIDKAKTNRFYDVKEYDEPKRPDMTAAEKAAADKADDDRPRKAGEK